MSNSDIPCLTLAITSLQTVGHFAVHVTKAPYAGGYVLHERVWADSLNQLWQAWQDLFSSRGIPHVPYVSGVASPVIEPGLLPDAPSVLTEQPIGRAGRLMQDLGISLWKWLFDGPIQGSLQHSQGFADGQQRALRVRLDIRDPDLIPLPWEIMQDEAGKQAISLRQSLLFSRTTSDVNMLPPFKTEQMLRILLVLGQDSDPHRSDVTVGSGDTLRLKQEAIALAEVLRTSGSTAIGNSTRTPCQVDTLVQPTPAELIRTLESQPYNVLFYSGHGAPGPDGGLLFIRPDMTLNGTELAQVLTRCQVKLAVFNACWGAQPDDYSATESGLNTSQAMPRSSLAEVLIHHGVPAVLGMRDSITDEEALSFIKAFARTLADGLPIDHAVAMARQHLLTLYKFNQQAWTLPVLYMHPEFDGQLILKPLEVSRTRMPGSDVPVGRRSAHATLRSLLTDKSWPIPEGGIVRVGRDRVENEILLQEDHGGVSRKHALIFSRVSNSDHNSEVNYFLRDFSTFGTLVLGPDGWQKVHYQEVPLESGTQLKFGSSQNEPFEFLIQTTPESQSKLP